MHIIFLDINYAITQDQYNDVRHKNQLKIFRCLIRLAGINTSNYKYGARKNQGERNKFWKFVILFTLETVIIIPSAFIHPEVQDTQIVLSLVNFSDNTE
jgi:hypothetical protein